MITNTRCRFDLHFTMRGAEHHRKPEYFNWDEITNQWQDAEHQGFTLSQFNWKLLAIELSRIFFDAINSIVIDYLNYFLPVNVQGVEKFFSTIANTVLSNLSNDESLLYGLETNEAFLYGLNYLPKKKLARMHKSWNCLYHYFGKFERDFTTCSKSLVLSESHS